MKLYVNWYLLILILIPRYTPIFCEENSNTAVIPNPKMGEKWHHALTKYEVLMENFLRNRFC